MALLNVLPLVLKQEEGALPLYLLHCGEEVRNAKALQELFQRNSLFNTLLPFGVFDPLYSLEPLEGGGGQLRSTKMVFDHFLMKDNFC